MIKPILRQLLNLLPYKIFLFKSLKKIITLPHSVYQHLHFKGIILIEVGKDYSFKTNHYGYQIENDLFWAGYGEGWEATSLKLWAIAAKHSDVILDIGANTGVYSLAAASVNPSSRIFAFEPLERIADKLQDNIRLNSFKIDANIVGVSSKTGTAEIYEPKTEHAYSASFNSEMLNDHDDIIKSSIPVTRMDDFLSEKKIEKIDLVKIDVEKFELDVLMGFGSIIERDKPTILIEILTSDLGRSVHEFLKKSNYEYYMIDENKEVRHVDTLEVQQKNFLLCTKENAAKYNLKVTNKHGEIII